MGAGEGRPGVGVWGGGEGVTPLQWDAFEGVGVWGGSRVETGSGALMQPLGSHGPWRGGGESAAKH